jgi:hypothetical protein
MFPLTAYTLHAMTALKALGFYIAFNVAWVAFVALFLGAGTLVIWFLSL